MAERYLYEIEVVVKTKWDEDGNEVEAFAPHETMLVYARKMSDAVYIATEAAFSENNQAVYDVADAKRIGTRLIIEEL